MRLIIEGSAKDVSDWSAKYIIKRIRDAKTSPNNYFVLGLPTGIVALVFRNKVFGLKFTIEKDFHTYLTYAKRSVLPALLCVVSNRIYLQLNNVQSHKLNSKLFLRRKLLIMSNFFVGE